MLTAIISLIFAVHSPRAYAENESKDSQSVEQIVKEKGITESPDTLVLIKDSANEKNWDKLKNKFFSISHPHCYIPKGEGGDSNPRISPNIYFDALEDCKSLIPTNYDFGTNSIPAGKTETAFSSIEIDTIFKQKMKINGRDARLNVHLLNRNSLPMVSWRIRMICGHDVRTIAIQAPTGKASQKILDTSDYTIPPIFRKIIATFECVK